jgi:hypothetical protein
MLAVKVQHFETPFVPPVVVGLLSMPEAMVCIINIKRINPVIKAKFVILLFST